MFVCFSIFSKWVNFEIQFEIQTNQNNIHDSNKIIKELKQHKWGPNSFGQQLHSPLF